ncbi:MAG: LysR family transcriptional regulator [Myxococcales bacterium]
MLHAIVHRPTDATRWDDLRVFLAVLRQGSFSGAASSLGIEQSTVSRRIAALEAALGAALFDRTAAGPRPSELALELREHAERVEQEILELLDHAGSQGKVVEGRVRLATTESFAVHVIIPHLLSGLRALHPELRVDLLVSERAADLTQREADVALRFFRPKQGDLVAKRIAVLPTVVLAHERYLAGRTELRVDTLDWIVLDHDSAEPALPAYLSAHGKLEPVLRTNGHLAQVEAVRAGLGVALLAKSLTRLDPGLKVLSLDLPASPPVELWLVTPRSLSRIPRIRALWEYLEKTLTALA